MAPRYSSGLTSGVFLQDGLAPSSSLVAPPSSGATTSRGNSRSRELFGGLPPGGAGAGVAGGALSARSYNQAYTHSTARAGFLTARYTASPARRLPLSLQTYIDADNKINVRHVLVSPRARVHSARAYASASPRIANPPVKPRAHSARTRQSSENTYYWKPATDAGRVENLVSADDSAAHRPLRPTPPPPRSSSANATTRGEVNKDTSIRAARAQLGINITLTKNVAKAYLKHEEDKKRKAEVKKRTGPGLLSKLTSAVNATVASSKTSSRFKTASLGESVQEKPLPPVTPLADANSQSAPTSARRRLRQDANKFLEELGSPRGDNEEDALQADRLLATKDGHLSEAQQHLQEITEHYNDEVMTNKAREKRIADMERQLEFYEDIIVRVKTEVRENDPSERVKAAKAKNVEMEDVLFFEQANTNTLHHIMERIVIDIQKKKTAIKQANEDLAAAAARIRKGEEAAMRLQNLWEEDMKKGKRAVRETKAQTKVHKNSVEWLKDEYRAEMSYWRVRENRWKEEEGIREEVANDVDINASARVKRDAARSTWREAQTNEEKERLRAEEITYRKVIQTVMNSTGLRTAEEVLTLLKDPDRKARESLREKEELEEKIALLEEQLKVETEELEKFQIMGVGRISVATSAFDKPISESRAKTSNLRWKLRGVDVLYRTSSSWLSELRDQLSAVTNAGLDLRMQRAAAAAEIEAQRASTPVAGVEAEDGDVGGDDTVGGGGDEVSGRASSGASASTAKMSVSNLEQVLKDLQQIAGHILHGRASGGTGLAGSGGSGVMSTDDGASAPLMRKTSSLRMKLKMIGSLGSIRTREAKAKEDDASFYNTTRELGVNNFRVVHMPSLDEGLDDDDDDDDDEGKGEEKSAAGDGAQPEVITRKMMLEARTPAKDKKQKKKEPSKKLGVRFT
ncbi:hypothetical protein RI054_29g119120 [Pseudoscourfieldia marina]